MTARALPDLSGSYRLPRQAVARFRRDGHVTLAGVLTREEIRAYRPRLRRVVARHSEPSDVSKFVTNLWTRDPAARRFVLSARLGRLAADLLGVDAVRLFGDSSFFKGPRSPNTAWHQDAPYTPLDPVDLVTFWIPLADLPPAMGPIGYVSRSHRAGYLGISGAGDADMDRFEAALAARGLAVARGGTFAAGDVAAHAGWTLHGARANTTSRTREAIVIIYFPDGARVAGDPPRRRGTTVQEIRSLATRRHNRATSLPGARPGEPAAGPRTPLVFVRHASASTRRRTAERS